MKKLSSTLKIFVVVTCLLPITVSAEDKTAMEWIQSMSESMRNLNYRGNFVYMHDDQLESMSISHTKDEFGEKERLLSLNGEAREVIRDNKNLTCIWPGSRKVVVDFSRKNAYSPLFIPDNVEKLSELYDIQLIGKDRIGGRKTVVVRIMPKDEYRYGLKFWISTDNALMMKSSLINDSDNVVEQVMFTNLELLKDDEKIEVNHIPPIDDNYTLIRNHSGENTGEPVRETTWQMTSMPAGFRQESILKRRNSSSGLSFHQVVYTDGLATLSIFIEKQAPQLRSGKTSMGAVNAYIRVMDDYSVTAIGEVPAVTVQSMAEAVLFQ